MSPCAPSSPSRLACPATPPLPAEALGAIFAKYGHNPLNLLQILREAQELTDWISPELIELCSAALAVPRAKVEGVAGFYAFLHLQPRGRYRVLFSDNITDRMQGSAALMDRLCHQLWVEAGKTSEDGLVSVARTSCTGLCDQGPALLVNQRAIGRLTPERIDQLGELIRSQTALAAWPAELFVIDSQIRRRDRLLDNQLPAGAALQAALQRDHALSDSARSANARSWREGLPELSPRGEGILLEIRAARLRGRGGAGFATAQKWEACRAAPLQAGQQRVVVCNADEGEPGTFKDRVLLSEQAGLVIEGMSIAALAIGASQGFIYLRGEYRYLLAALEDELARRRQQGLLGRQILGISGFDFEISIHVGAGAYVCGEESALIESLEGKRGTPRNRPPFPVTHGYCGQPTVVNNVETYACAALIAYHGAPWFTARGSEHSSGTKLLSVAGDCARPGIYEYPFGVSIAQVLDDCGAENPQAVQVGGPSGVTAAPHEFARDIAFEDIPSAGAFTIFDQRRDLFDVARNYVQFFAHESCGFCTPCRVGTSLLRNLMDKLAEGRGSPYDFNEINQLNGVLQRMSHCGLGHSACNPVLDTIEKFRPAYDRRLAHQEFRPSFDLDHELSEARRMTGRQDAEAHFDDAREPQA